ncbi:hypothetical protein SAMN05421819_4124 [Bryocella elongata]|uniref:Uncharacterized protein n=1 Tax=Bryocella elongata TaxID=863522 RepID=A0A1H6C185_9BACT|nr:hypothetical protein [Bryocella elongata]SEG66415.1 hypothetical protein SAMN05421819_4124 [Bryocella elongata]
MTVVGELDDEDEDEDEDEDDDEEAEEEALEDEDVTLAAETKRSAPQPDRAATAHTRKSIVLAKEKGVGLHAASFMLHESA